MRKLSYKSLPWKTWRTANLWDINLYITRLPLCGQRHMWVKVGRKYVTMCEPISHIKFRIRKSEWDGIKHKRQLDEYICEAGYLL